MSKEKNQQIQSKPAHKKFRLRNRGFVLGGAFLIVLAGIAVSERVSVKKIKPEITETLNSYMGEIAQLNMAKLGDYKLGEDLTTQQKNDIKSRKSEIADKYWSASPMYKISDADYQNNKSDFVSAEIEAFGKYGTSQKYDVKLKDAKSISIVLEGNNFAEVEATYLVEGEGFYSITKDDWENHYFQWDGLPGIDPNGNSYSYYSWQEDSRVTQHLQYTEEITSSFVMEKTDGEWKITYMDSWSNKNITDYSVVDD